MELVVRRLGHSLRATRDPIEDGDTIHEVCDDEGDDDAAKLLEPCSRPMEIAHDRACRAGFSVSCGLDGTEQ
ncbi:hypothetical protein M885DRAFT_572765 [Pelagophyceae sp. CCMP2097]|nr:hypothetical protein M885DRAFT_572765 [Pelagophyceae sp. CCMP2097]